MDVLLILQHPGSVDGGDAHLVPLHIMHVILVNPQLSTSKGDSRHLVLEGTDIECSGDDVVEKKLWIEE